jgi:phosphohistidine phosphatase SixA
MISNLSHTLNRFSARNYSRKKAIRLATLVLSSLLLIGATTMVMRPAPMTDLAEAHHALKADFYSQWDKGDLVVLMRHVERCDHSTNPCLDPPDGITVKGRAVAERLGQSFQQLGLNQTDIFNSPLQRTEQTSRFAFNQKTHAQDWLINCRRSMLDDVLKHKLDHRNLVLVTHSECITELEKSLKVSAPWAAEYGSSLIVSINPTDHSAHVLGYVDAQDWGKVLARRP